MFLLLGRKLSFQQTDGDPTPGEKKLDLDKFFPFDEKKHNL